jgi:hypothetical protein
MADQDKEGRDQQARLAEDVLQQSNEDILKEIFYHSSIPPHHTSDIALTRTLAYFSALLYRLSLQAEESTKKTVDMTRKLLYLTWAIVILTAILLLVGFFDFPKKSLTSDLKPNQRMEQTSQHQSFRETGAQKESIVRAPSIPQRDKPRNDVPK